ncbi:hypothetical protein [Roseibium sp.]|uniref:hypothetical protein n=1 Tax=Roseibium sp. TaxID=1936156 RepID=UPI00391DCAA2
MTLSHMSAHPVCVASLVQINDKLRQRNPGVDLEPILGALVSQPLTEERPEALALCGGLTVTPFEDDDVSSDEGEVELPQPADFEHQVLMHMGDSVRLFKKWELASAEYLVVRHSWEDFQKLTYRDFEKIAELARKERSRASDPDDCDDIHFDEMRFLSLAGAIEQLGGKLVYGMVSVREFLVKVA